MVDVSVSWLRQVMPLILREVSADASIQVPEEWLLAEVLPVAEHEAQAVEVWRAFKAHTDIWTRRRQAAPRTPPQREFIDGLRDVAKAVGYRLDIRA